MPRDVLINGGESLRGKWPLSPRSYRRVTCGWHPRLPRSPLTRRGSKGVAGSPQGHSANLFFRNLNQKRAGRTPVFYRASRGHPCTVSEEAERLSKVYWQHQLHRCPLVYRTSRKALGPVPQTQTAVPRSGRGRRLKRRPRMAESPRARGRLSPLGFEESTDTSAPLAVPPAPPRLRNLLAVSAHFRSKKWKLAVTAVAYAERNLSDETPKDPMTGANRLGGGRPLAASPSRNKHA
ncbi:hypothetical protein SKAU_G00304440 [Synaphobranchus kaupii]|uniref:Uncharacterized protein n=1 Tax=Synaphobranchus kaupii TaxID=118154 RepID=A0A9Q1EWB1_SYNKA|nr:hypothetical protein SKAU_G00304440 [Synaphobranchus kaupii]